MNLEGMRHEPSLALDQDSEITSNHIWRVGEAIQAPEWLLLGNEALVESTVAKTSFYNEDEKIYQEVYQPGIRIGKMMDVTADRQYSTLEEARDCAIKLIEELKNTKSVEEWGEVEARYGMNQRSSENWREALEEKYPSKITGQE